MISCNHVLRNELQELSAQAEAADASLDLSSVDCYNARPTLEDAEADLLRSVADALNRPAVKRRDPVESLEQDEPCIPPHRIDEFIDIITNPDRDCLYLRKFRGNNSLEAVLRGTFPVRTVAEGLNPGDVIAALKKDNPLLEHDCEFYRVSGTASGEAVLYVDEGPGKNWDKLYNQVQLPAEMKIFQMFAVDRSRGLGTIFDCLSHPDENVREHAISELIECGNPVFLERLHEYIVSDDRFINNLDFLDSARKLFKHFAAHGEHIVLQLAYNPLPSLREFAAQCMRDLPKTRHIQSALDLLAGEWAYPYVQEAALASGGGK